jgi:nucleoside-diphosphate kinase
MKMLRVTPELAAEHYQEHVEKPFYPGLRDYITSAPVVAMLVEGLEAIRVVRELLGPTNGRNAPAGTVRGDFSCSRQTNLVHASDGPESAAREINLYFHPEEICEFSPAITPWLRAAGEN